MKVLHIHTYYLQKGGEDVFVEEERRLIGQTENIRTLSFRNRSGIRGIFQFGFSIWNLFAAGKLKKLISEYRPDVIHIHNLHFAIGPLAIRVAKKANVPVVLTLHNYRLLCPSATLLHKGTLFVESVNSPFPWKAIRNKVYRDSFFQTFWLAFIVWFHKKIGTWKMVDKYIVLTEFAKDLFVNSSFGLPSEKFLVKSNFKNRTQASPVKKDKHFLFVGRLSDEKGVRVLLEAFSLTDSYLHIAGDGPLKSDVLEACDKYKNMNFLGNLDKAGVESSMQQCTALIFPSIWYEGLPMTIIEAFASGTPVIASNLGAMASIIQDGYNGLHFKAGDAGGLTEKLDLWQKMEEPEQEKYRENAYSSYQTHYTPEKNKVLLINIYKSITHAKATD